MKWTSRGAIAREWSGHFSLASPKVSYGVHYEMGMSYLKGCLGIKELMRRLLVELLKDSKRSDRELAKVLKCSQATVSRMRHTLVKEGIIQGFTVMPDFAKLGYEIMAITLAKAKITLSPSEQEKASKLVLEDPRVIFVAPANGLGKNGVMISLHRNYSDYSSFMSELQFKSEGYMENVDTVIVSLKSPVVKPLSLAYLAKDISPEH